MIETPPVTHEAAMKMNTINIFNLKKPEFLYNLRNNTKAKDFVNFGEKSGESPCYVFLFETSSESAPQTGSASGSGSDSSMGAPEEGCVIASCHPRSDISLNSGAKRREGWGAPPMVGALSSDSLLDT